MPGRVDAAPALQDRPIEVNEKWCKGCDICVAFCPKAVLERPEGEKARVAHPERCTRCGLCEIMCPDFAITVAPVRKPSPREQGGGANA